MLKPTKNISKFSKKELDHFFAIARCVKKNQAFTFLTAPTHHTGGRILIVVPKKYGNAPARNKIRRQLKTIYTTQELYSLMLDVAIIVRPTARKYDFEQLTQLLLSIFKPS
ncbi:ribonuclease P protein component [Candidatus Babeliales bacterium]|nr:ribonuclease P protein component [Candidatus Babeliales bacterium]